MFAATKDHLDILKSRNTIICSLKFSLIGSQFNVNTTGCPKKFVPCLLEDSDKTAKDPYQTFI